MRQMAAPRSALIRAAAALLAVLGLVFGCQALREERGESALQPPAPPGPSAGAAGSGSAQAPSPGPAAAPGTTAVPGPSGPAGSESAPAPAGASDMVAAPGTPRAADAPAETAASGGGALPPAATAPSAAGSAATPGAGATGAGVAPEAAAPAEQATGSALSATAPGAQAAAPEAPAVDTFSLQLDGTAVLAGRAPGAVRVEALVEGAVAASAVPGGQGRFAMLFDLAPSAEARSLTLRSIAADGGSTLSDQVLLIAPVALAAAEPAPADLAQGGAAADSGGASQAQAAGSAAAGGQAGATAAEAAEEPGAQAAAGSGSAELGFALADPATVPSNLLVSPSGGVQVLRRKASKGLSIDSIAYGADGAVQIAGHSDPGSNLRLYLNNGAKVDLTSNAEGEWLAQLPGIGPGLYTLRADQTSAEGQVTARAETPFLRESPEALAAGPAEGSTARVVTVQPGFTLWGIAETSFGDGFQYVKVFEANRAQIRDPDLIYPGQVFSLPE